jgi:hypothetical protein
MRRKKKTSKSRTKRSEMTYKPNTPKNGEGNQSEFPCIGRPFGAFSQKVVLTDDPERLDQFWTTVGEIEDVIVTHSLKTRIRVVYGIEEPLGNTCPFCGEALKYRGGEFQNRIHCGCTMVLFPLAFPDPEEDEESIVGCFMAIYGPEYPDAWRTLIREVRRLQRRK